MQQSTADARQGRPGGLLYEAPEYPALTPGVELVGEMKETGFKERQWLVQRGGRFIQLTELLYRVVEQANGKRTLEEIAQGVTEATEWLVSADHVRKVLQSKLIPIGLIAPADGVATSPRKSGGRSSVAVNLRTRILGPRIIDPIAGVLRYFYAPMVLTPVLVAAVVAHCWLYLVHGVAESFRAVVYAPELMLAALAIMFLAGVFHEFGHAAALRYGGGRTREMGVGLYLVYPVFYTDATDGYRLGRWARVRTDLGGFYFYMIFALGLMGLYLISGQEFLLLVVLMITLDIVYQFTPFFRFDGYWTLADLTGIPDFFSQMGAFLRSIVPIARWKGTKLPHLKPWVKTVFVTYVLVTVPVISLILFYFVDNVPVIMSATWDSLLHKAKVVSAALGDDDYMTVAIASVQALIIELQMFAIAYLLYILGRRLLFGAIWSRAKSTPGRRALGALTIAGVIALVALLWSN